MNLFIFNQFLFVGVWFILIVTKGMQFFDYFPPNFLLFSIIDFETFNRAWICSMEYYAQTIKLEHHGDPVG
jgi:hypothetical protein